MRTGRVKTIYVYPKLSGNEVRILIAALELLAGRCVGEWPRIGDVGHLQTKLAEIVPDQPGPTGLSPLRSPDQMPNTSLNH